MKSRRLTVFLKVPRPGWVKTRIAEALDPEAAAAIYRILIQRTLAALADLEHVEVRYAPDDAAKEVQPWLRREWTMVPQGDGDLGQRMAAAVGDARAAGVEEVVLIGSDCPALQPADFAAAYDALEHHDAVIGPATDGGYWLLGLGPRAADLPAVWFQDMPWSTDQVFSLTIDNAQAAGLSCHRLRELRDVDTLEDWREWLRHSPL